jgi:hypothetical protein
LGLLVLSRLYATLTILMEFLAISAKTVLGQGFSDLLHQLEIVGEIVDSIEL